MAEPRLLAAEQKRLDKAPTPTSPVKGPHAPYERHNTYEPTGASTHRRVGGLARAGSGEGGGGTGGGGVGGGGVGGGGDGVGSKGGGVAGGGGVGGGVNSSVIGMSSSRSSPTFKVSSERSLS